MGIRGRVEQLQNERARRTLVGAGVHLGEGARVATGSRISPRTNIGAHTAINGPARIAGLGHVEIGPYCAIGEELRVLAGNHSMRYPNIKLGLHWQHNWVELDEGANVSIGAACWFGDRTMVMPGVTIGAGAVIAAGAVVTREVAPYTVVGGVPAKQLKERCSRPVADALVDIAWWDWTEDRIARNRAFFEIDISAADVSPEVLRATIVS